MRISLRRESAAVRDDLPARSFEHVERTRTPPPEADLPETTRELVSIPSTNGNAPSRAGARSGSAAVGRDGTSYYGPAVIMGGEDENPEMFGREKFRIYREMRNDPGVRSLEWLYKLPIRGAHWTLIEPDNDPDGEAVAKARADAARWNFGLEEETGVMDLSWSQWMAQSLLYLPMGAHGEELIKSADVVMWKDADGDEHPIRPFARFAPRHAATVTDIETDPNTGLIKRIRQDLPGADWIPGDRLAWYVLEPEGANPWGTSLLRTAYYAWKSKKGLMTAAGIAWDRWSSGIPIVRHPPGIANQRRADEIGYDLRHHERAYVTLEDAAEEDLREWGIEILNGQASIMDPVPLLRHYDQQIAMAGLQQFSSLGTTETGSRAVGSVLAEPYYLAVQAIAGEMAEWRTKWAIRRFYDENFGTEIPCPKVNVSKIQARNMSVLARTLADLASAGITLTDLPVINDLRDQLDFERLSEDAAEIIDGLPGGVGVARQRVRPAAVEGGSIAP